MSRVILELDTSANKKPSVYDYTSAIHFFKDAIAHLQHTGGYSSRKFATKAGFKSKSFVRMLLQEKRRLTVNAASKIAEGLLLTESELEYFQLLIQLDRAETAAEKSLLLGEISKRQGRSPSPSKEFISSRLVIHLPENKFAQFKKRMLQIQSEFEAEFNDESAESKSYQFTMQLLRLPD